MAAANTDNSLIHVLQRDFLSEDAGTSDGVTTLAGLEVEGTSLFTGAVVASAGITAPRPVVSAAATLTAAQSGSLVLFPSASACLYTLPAPTAGLWFDFLTTVTATGAHKVITNAGTVFIAGTLVNTDTDTSNAVAAWLADPAATVAINSNGTTTGGVKGQSFRLVCVNATTWVVTGQTLGTGIVATPFAAS